jgi:recombinational DNA repair protein (RecF pathway)
MQIIKNIFVVFITLITLMGSNGFILEKYSCSECHEQKQEVQFFEFGEISHNHPHCTKCVDEHHECNCHLDDHLNNTEISYISLEVLFFNSEKPEINKASSTELLSQSYNINPISLINSNFNKLLNRYIKIPPFPFNNKSGTSKCAQISVFRL